MALDAVPHLPGAADTIGGRIRQARRFAEFSQSELARAIDAHRDSVINWEKDRISPSVESLLLIARKTHFPIAWFVDGLDANGGDDGSGSTVGNHHSNLIPFPGIAAARPSFELAATG